MAKRQALIRKYQVMSEKNTRNTDIFTEKTSFNGASAVPWLD